MAAEHLLDRTLRIDRARIDGKAGVLGRKAPLGFRIAEIVPDQIHQIAGIFAVVNGEGALDADAFGVFAQKPRADRVKGAGPGNRRRSSGHRGGTLAQRVRRNVLDAARHLGCCAARKGEQQHAARIGAVDDQMGDAVRKRIGLAGARPGNDQKRTGLGKRAAAMLDGAALLRIERAEIGRSHDARRPGASKLATPQNP